MAKYYHFSRLNCILEWIIHMNHESPPSQTNNANCCQLFGLHLNREAHGRWPTVQHQHLARARQPRSVWFVLPPTPRSTIGKINARKQADRTPNRPLNRYILWQIVGNRTRRVVISIQYTARLPMSCGRAKRGGGGKHYVVTHPRTPKNRSANKYTGQPPVGNGCQERQSLRCRPESAPEPQHEHTHVHTHKLTRPLWATGTGGGVSRFGKQTAQRSECNLLCSHNPWLNNERSHPGNDPTSDRGCFKKEKERSETPTRHHNSQLPVPSQLTLKIEDEFDTGLSSIVQNKWWVGCSILDWYLT